MKNLFILFFIGILSVSCSQSSSNSFSLLADQAVLKQSATYTQRKLDILWVIDNSNSMETSQKNVADNVHSFMQRFMARNYDYHMAVTTTDTYLGTLKNIPSMLRFPDGTDIVGHSGYHVMTQDTPNVEDVFAINISQGVLGYGDERAFQSFRDALNSSLNSDFLREDAFLAIIIVSDEDDFSHDSIDYSSHNYNYPGLDTVQSYIDFLDNLKPLSEGNRNYSVSAISIFDDTCLAELQNSFSGRIIGYRYKNLVDATGGVKGSLCDNFADSLTLISDTIVSLTTQFLLDREPYVETITVSVNGNEILQDDTNGWSYNETQNSITFHGSSIPPDGADIKIGFEPKTIKN